MELVVAPVLQLYRTAIAHPPVGVAEIVEHEPAQILFADAAMPAVNVGITPGATKVWVGHHGPTIPL